MARVKVILRINQVVLDEDLVPRSDKVRVDIVRGLQIAVHAHESGHRAVYRIVERDSVERLKGLLAKEKLIL
jgi:hypothetical protein